MLWVLLVNPEQPCVSERIRSPLEVCRKGKISPRDLLLYVTVLGGANLLGGIASRV